MHIKHHPLIYGHRLGGFLGVIGMSPIYHYYLANIYNMRITPVITGAITETNISCHINSPPPCYTHGVIGDFIIIPSVNT